jgi:MarR family transcriptional regulator, organic hydroperoxide resistance regulator
MHQNIDSLTERFDKSLFVLLQNLGPQLINRAQLGLTPGQVFMLHFIQQDSQCSVSKLAEKMEVAPSAITVMLDRLENHGFVARTRDKVDRRVVIINLTDVGEEKLNHVLDVRKQIMQHCLTQIEFNELNSFIQTLEKLSPIAQAMDIKAIGLSNEEG